MIMTKQDAIEAIVKCNLSAKREFLDSFDEPQLRAYLKRLDGVTIWHEVVVAPRRIATPNRGKRRAAATAA